jgi:hypothetical protein
MSAVAGFVDDGHIGNEFTGAAGNVPTFRPFSKSDVGNDGRINGRQTPRFWTVPAGITPDLNRRLAVANDTGYVGAKGYPRDGSDSRIRLIG